MFSLTISKQSRNSLVLCTRLVLCLVSIPCCTRFCDESQKRSTGMVLTSCSSNRGEALLRNLIPPLPNPPPTPYSLLNLDTLQVSAEDILGRGFNSNCSWPPAEPSQLDCQRRPSSNFMSTSESYLGWNQSLKDFIEQFSKIIGIH